MMSQPPETPKELSNQPNAASKLWVRSEVLAVVALLKEAESQQQPMPRQNKQLLVKRLKAVDNQASVQEVLLKELARCKALDLSQVLGELLMELGTLEVVKEPLWQVIRSKTASDDVKDVANLVLRHLGDETDPELYLDYLEDPAALITRETQRMLEVAQENPEALIDFLDFIASLPEEEQVSLVESLHGDYPSAQLLLMDKALLHWQPDAILSALVVELLANSKLPEAASLLLAYKQSLEAFEVPASTEPEQGAAMPRLVAALPKAALRQETLRKVKTALSKLRLAGVYNSYEQLTALPATALKHGLLADTTLDGCFATLPDGQGNQGLFISRKWANGDFTLVCLAINDTAGVLDTFGFYQLSPEELEKLRQKFHHDSSRIEIPAAYCKARLQQAEALTFATGGHLPYEYTCWKVALEDAESAASEADTAIWPTLQWLQSNVRPELESITDSLYQHPDFITWFVTANDLSALAPVLQEQRFKLNALLQNHGATLVERNALPCDLQEACEAMATQLETVLLEQPAWLSLLSERLKHAAYLLHLQQAPTFCRLAATAASVLTQEQFATPNSLGKSAFFVQYARRCFLETVDAQHTSAASLPKKENVFPVHELLKAEGMPPAKAPVDAATLEKEALWAETLYTLLDKAWKRDI